MSKPDDDADAPDERWVYIGKRRVDSSGRVSIPVDRYGLSTADVIHVTIETDGASFLVPDSVIETQRRVTIPARQRRIHGVSAGDEVDVTFQKTGLTSETE